MQSEVAPGEFTVTEDLAREDLIASSPVRQDKFYQDMQGHWKQAWPYYVKGNWQNVCAITDKPVEESSEEQGEDVRAKRMQEVATCRDVLTPTREKVRE